jgi:hypothetical protein
VRQETLRTNSVDFYTRANGLGRSVLR